MKLTQVTGNLDIFNRHPRHFHRDGGFYFKILPEHFWYNYSHAHQTHPLSCQFFDLAVDTS